MQAAVKRYRAMAYLVGTLLILLCVGVVLKYGAGRPELSSVVGPVHGLCYMIYLLFAFDLYRKAGWPLSRMVMMVAAGLVPFLAFFVERKITHEAAGEGAAEAVARP